MREKEMLKIVNFSKQYGSKIAVSNLNLLVQKGDIMGFIGKNGAGKTTTLKACMGIIRPTTGDIYVNDVYVKPDAIVFVNFNANANANANANVNVNVNWNANWNWNT